MTIPNKQNQNLLRIGIFYDGNFFFHVSNYYRYVHPRKKRISIPGLHQFIRHHTAQQEHTNVRLCHVVDAHFFRGRLSAREADQRQKLYAERVFDDILMGQGIVTHYLPVRRRSEKGIDVWLALEAYELAVHKQFNVLVIIGGDADFIPLARKVNSLGTRVMILGWDFKFTDDHGRERETVTSVHLLEEVTYPVSMSQIIEDTPTSKDPIINNLFVTEQDHTKQPQDNPPETEEDHNHTDHQNHEEYPTHDADPPQPEATTIQGQIMRLEKGYGFIKAEGYPNNVFFHYQDVTDCDFNELREGETVTFDVAQGAKGPQAINIRTT